jgi:hypothetical protein
MIKEFAFGTANRHHFQDAEKMQDWKKLDKDTFVSLYDYDDYVVEYYTKTKSLSGFDGMIYIPDEFILDVDASSIEKGLEKLHELNELLATFDIPSYKYFSGTGFHVHIPGKAFRWKPSSKLHINVKEVLTNAGIFNYADPSVTDKTRIIRLINTKNSKSNLYKVWLPNWKTMTVEEIEVYAKSPKPEPLDELHCEPVFDVLEKPSKKKESIKISQGRNPDPVNHTCIQKMMHGVTTGKRHMVALRLAAYLRWRFPEDVVRMLMENWRMKVSSPDNVFNKTEMDNLVEGCYSGHGGNGYRYGCHDSIMDEYCDSTCKLYKAKKSQTTMDAAKMEEVMVKFFEDQSEPINLGKLYGKHFPVYPGEVVIIQAPPASMKTMLLQNWMVQLKRPTYFLEMEMSPRQIWSRFVQIEMGWTEEELVSHYKQFRNGMEDKFKWLIVDYSAPYANEIEKRITMLPRKPELVVVDHIGLMRSKQHDNNMKVEDVSQALMELAVKHNVVVIAVSEISKSAFIEGMNIASSKGSFRIAYNANKVLSLTPFRNKKGLIEMLELDTTKNREKEYLHVKLNVNNLRIEA